MSSNQILIQQITKQISFYMPIILLIFGSFGFVCNFITFTSKQLKTNVCAFYFLCISIIELVTFYFGLISRLANDNLGSTLFSTNKIYCKIRSYLVVMLPSIITYMILLTTIDRFMSAQTEVRYRSFSQLKVAYRIVPMIIIISMILSSHMLIFFDFYPSCTAQPGFYSIFYSVYLIIWTAILPNGFICFFNVLTFRHAIRRNRRIAPIMGTTTVQQRHAQRIESQLIVMMFGQAILSNILDLSRISLYTYFVLVTDIPKSSYQQSINSLLLQITIFLLYTNCSKSFYVYTLTSGFFRKIFRQSVYRYYRKILHILHIKQEYNLNESPLNQHELQTMPRRQAEQH